jgi:hypothetical protein|tara:strand:- start:402 stop:671 length:270 start_codon:yes stop_codon:yes gene_type:complete
MNKLRFFTTLSKCFGYAAWAGSNVINLISKTGKKTYEKVKNVSRYDVDIYNKNEQMEAKLNLTQSEVMKILDSMDILSDLSVIVTKKVQ